MDILQGYTFAVIVENCDVEWYASEKLYDALLAGAIPLYYGNVPPQLGIPEGADEGVYLDLKRVLAGCPRDQRASARVQDFLDALTQDQVAAWKARVAARRAEVLAAVGTRAFADCVAQALQDE